jgi:hypothetical protein
MTQSLSPFAIGFLPALVVFALISRTGRLSPDFSAIAAAIVSAPILVFLAAAVTAVVIGLTGEYASLAMFAATLGFALVTFAPTVLLLLPLFMFYLIRALQKKRLLSRILVSGIGVCCIAVQIAWLNTLSNAFD